MNEDKVRMIVQQELAKSQQSARFNLNNIVRHTHNGIDSPRINANNIVPGLRTLGTITMAQQGQTYTLNTGFQASTVLFCGTPYHLSGGVVQTVSIAAGGSGYSQGDILTLQGGTNGSVQVTSVSSGVITGISLKTAGFGYTAGTVTTTGGTGSGATITITVSGGSSIDIHTFVWGYAALGQNLPFQPVYNANGVKSTTSVIAGGKKEIIQGSTNFTASGSGNTSSFAGTQDENHIVNVDYGSGTAARATISGYSPSSISVYIDTLSNNWVIIGNWFVF